jgi:hypothetical protein
VEVKTLDKHLQWLNRRLSKLSNDSQVHVSSPNGSLFELALKARSMSRREIKDQRCVFQLHAKSGNVKLYGEFREQWERENGPQKRPKKYDFRQLSVKLTVDDSELLSVHWNCPPGNNELYQPHIHIGLNSGHYTVRKMHLPMNIEWCCREPDNLDDYQKWLEGLIRFLQTEVPRAFK